MSPQPFGEKKFGPRGVAALATLNITPPLKPNRIHSPENTVVHDERPEAASSRFVEFSLGALRFGPGLILVLLVVTLGFSTQYFFTARNLGNVLAQTAAIAVLAMGQHLVILTRGIDLSVGSVLALSSVMGALVYRQAHSGPLIIAVMIGTGMAVGFVNGFVYVWGRLPHPFIITLATLSIARNDRLGARFGSGGLRSGSRARRNGAMASLGPMDLFSGRQP
jgi:hypothetical protein